MSEKAEEKEIACIVNISNGNASRFIRSNWLDDDAQVKPSAFDLRECTPPEKYVSLFLVNDGDTDKQVADAYKIIRKKLSLKNDKGAIAVLDISVCLEEINDEEKEIIAFTDEKIPHCGLNYVTQDPRRIVEAKNTLCFLANERLRTLKQILRQMQHQDNELGSDSLLIIEKPASS